MRPAFVLGVVGTTSIAPESVPSVEHRVRLVLRYLKYGAQASDPDAVDVPRSLGESLILALGHTALEAELRSWRGLGSADLIVLSNLAPGADQLVVRVQTDLGRLDPTMRWRAALPFPARTLQRRALATPEAGTNAAFAELMRAADPDAVWLSRLCDDPAEAAAFDARLESDIESAARRRARYEAANQDLVLHSDALLAIYAEPASAESLSAETVSRWLQSSISTSDGRSAVLEWSRGMLFHCGVAEHASTQAPLALLIDPIDGYRSGPPVSQTDRERRRRNLLHALTSARGCATWQAERERAAYITPNQANAEFQRLLHSDAPRAHSLERELRRAGHTQFLIDLKALARLRAEAANAAQALAPRLAPWAFVSAIAAALCLHAFQLEALAASLRAAACFLAIAFSAGAWFLFRSHNQRRRSAESYRVTAEALRVQFAWAFSGSAQNVAERGNHPLHAALRPILSRVRSATAPLERFRAQFSELAAPLKVAVLRSVVETWCGGQERYFATRAEAHALRRVHWRNVLSTTVASGLLVWITVACTLLCSTAHGGLTQRATLTLLAVWLFAWILGPLADVGSWLNSKSMRKLVDVIGWALPLAALVLYVCMRWSPTPHTAQAFAVAAGGTLLACAALGFAFIDQLLSAALAQRYRPMHALFHRVRVDLDTRLARMERAIGTADAHSIAVAEAAVRSLLHDLGEAAIVENGAWLSLHRERPFASSVTS